MGIHGPNTVQAVRDVVFAEANAANLKFVSEMGTAWGAPYPNTWALYDAFGNYGGSGMTLGLIIAIFIFSRQRDQKDIAKLSLAPGLFNINESVIFGLPIVLNPILIVPFVGVPVVNLVLSTIATNMGIIPYTTGVSLPWTTPIGFSGYLSTGSVMAGVWQIGLLLLGCIIYYPFIKMLDKQYLKDEEKSANEQSVDDISFDDLSFDDL